jgi:hypothetical protein
MHAKSEGDADALNKLTQHFHEIGEGIGVHKSPALYGAFPTDPYSHTPWHRGAQQPGMTGQVKEDILARFGALGVKVSNGQLHFDPFLLQPDDFIKEARDIELFDLEGLPYTLSLPENALAFTLCQVPVVYRRGAQSGMEVHFSDGRTSHFDQAFLDTSTSLSIFERRNLVKQVTVHLNTV